MRNYDLVPTFKRTGRIRPLHYVVIFSCMVVLPASIIHGLLGINERTAFALISPGILVLYLITQKGRIPKLVPMLVLVLMITGLIASMVSSAVSQLLMGTALAVAVVVGRQLFLSLSRPKVLRMVSRFALALMVGGMIGIGYAIAGGAPLLEVKAGYRTSYLYLTTFSFAFIGNIIRPSGIFDEPGSLVMFVTVVTMFNDTFRQNQRLNQTLVVLLVFTGTLAGLAIATLYVFTSNAMRTRVKRNSTTVVALVAGLGLLSFTVPSNPISATLDTFYSARFVIEDGRLAGDNRSNQIVEFFEIVDDDMLLSGAKNGLESYNERDQSSHPFSIIFGYGFIIWLPYATLLLWLLGITIFSRFNNAYSSIGLMLLLLQRPFLYNMAWSVLIVATVWLIYTAAHRSSNRDGRAQ